MIVAPIEKIEPGSIVEFLSTHPTRANRRCAVQHKVDRGDMTNKAGFADGVWVLLDTLDRIAVWSRTEVALVDGSLKKSV